MSYTLADLRNTPDELLIDGHDRAAKNAVVSVNYYLAELERRDRERHDEAMHGLTVQMRDLTQDVRDLTETIKTLTLGNIIVASMAMIAAVVALVS